MPDLSQLEKDLRTALVLKADDILFTLGGPEGARLQQEFLGVCTGGEFAADALVKPDDLAQIDLSRFKIANDVKVLHAMLTARSLGLSSGERAPDADTIRQDALDFLEHFLSTLPQIALGAWDSTSVRNGPLRDFYDDCAAWTNLIEAIAGAFYDSADLYWLRVTDLARLSSVELRTMRNKVGPSKSIRTTSERSYKGSRISNPSFVGVNTIDALDWLASRPKFSIEKIEAPWVKRRIADASKPATVGRSAVVMGLLNVGSLSKLAQELGWTAESVKRWGEHGPTGNADEAAALANLIGIDADFYAQRCSSLSN